MLPPSDQNRKILRAAKVSLSYPSFVYSEPSYGIGEGCLLVPKNFGLDYEWSNSRSGGFYSRDFEKINVKDYDLILLEYSVFPFYLDKPNDKLFSGIDKIIEERFPWLIPYIAS